MHTERTQCWKRRLFNVITIITAYAYRNRLKFLCIKDRYLFLMTVIVSALVVGKRNCSMGYVGKDIDRVKRSVQNHPVSVPNCPTEIPHGMACDGSRTFCMTGLRLPAWAMERPTFLWSCLRQEGCSNVQWRPHSPINEADQLLNCSAEKNRSLLKF